MVEIERRVVTNYWLVSYQSKLEDANKGFVVDNLLTKSKFLVSDPVIFMVLSFCSTKPQRISAVKSFLQRRLKVPQKDVDPLINDMIRKRFLISDGSEAEKIYKLTRFWRDYGWTNALDYYVSTRDFPFINYANTNSAQMDAVFMRAFAADGAPPKIFKTYSKTKKIRLSNPKTYLSDVPMKDAMLNRIGDVEDYVINYKRPTEPLSEKQISSLLFYAFGQTGHVKYPVQGDFLLKCVPSGGARHPIEAYVVLLDSELGKGVFHYSVKDHALERLDCDLSAVTDTIYQLKYGVAFKPKAIIIVSAILERSMWRYREPRTYRVIQFDLGHVLETIGLVCIANGLEIFFARGYADTKLESRLNLDSAHEPVLQTVAIG